MAALHLRRYDSGLASLIKEGTAASLGGCTDRELAWGRGRRSRRIIVQLPPPSPGSTRDSASPASVIPRPLADAQPQIQQGYFDLTFFDISQHGAHKKGRTEASFNGKTADFGSAYVSSTLAASAKPQRFNCPLPFGVAKIDGLQGITEA